MSWISCDFQTFLNKKCCRNPVFHLETLVDPLDLEVVQQIKTKTKIIHRVWETLYILQSKYFAISKLQHTTFFSGQCTIAGTI